MRERRPGCRARTAGRRPSSCSQPRHVRVQPVVGGLTGARKIMTSSAGRSRSSVNVSTFCGSSAATRSGPRGRPTSVEVSTSSASWASPLPSWVPNIRPPIWPMIASIGPACARPPRAAPRLTRWPPAGPAGRTAASTWAGSRPPIRCADQALASVAPAGKLGGRVEPQLGQLHRVADGRALAAGQRRRGGRELLVRHLRGEVVVDRTAAARLRLAQLCPSWVSIWPSWLTSNAPPAGHTGHTRNGAEAERILRLVRDAPAGRGRRHGRRGPNPNGTSLIRPRYAADVRLSETSL